MPGEPHPILDTWAPAQWVAGTSGGAGPQRSIFANSGSTQMSNSNGYDTTRHYKIAGTIVTALVVIFVLQLMGFRFVGAASVGFGR